MTKRERIARYRREIKSLKKRSAKHSQSGDYGFALSLDASAVLVQIKLDRALGITP